MTRRQWAIRVPFVLVITGVTWGIATLMDFRPDLLLVLLYVTVGTALFSVAYQTFRDSPVSWEPQQSVSMRPLSQDVGTNSAMRMLESHLTAAEPNALVRDRLGRLAEARMRQRHGFGLADPKAHDLLGEQVLTVLQGPVRRLNKFDIARIVTRIEEL